MNHGSLFSGIGGFDLAAEWMGWANVFHCEINPFGQKVLKYYWPNAITYTDITKTDFTIHRGGIDILTGGFPCQPFSAAGKRKGTEDSRHLWPEMLRAIREIQPRYIVGENVRGITNWNAGMVFDQVQADLEAEGFEVLPFLLPACGVNAPHRRDRVWFVAHTKDFNASRGGESENRERQSNSQIRPGLRNESGSNGQSGAAANGCDEGLQGRQARYKSQAGMQPIDEQLVRCDFIPGQNWQNFPTQSPICRGNDGLSPELSGITISKHRKESIMAYGNSVVPQLVYEIFKAIDLTKSEVA